MIGDKVFEEKYKNLNKEQKKAVDTIDGPVLVVAGPGTGKTTILTLRIAEILRRTDTPAHGILAITYTDAGVKAMREKLREIIGNRAHEVYIHTFHSFASSMMSEYPDHFLRIGDFKQMNDVDQESLVRNIISDSSFSSLRPVARPDTYIISIIKTISDAKKDAMTPDMVREYAKQEIKNIRNDDSNISTRGVTKGKLKADALEKIEKLEKTLLFADVYQKYEEEKNKLKLKDYDDLIIELLVALRTDELFLRLIQERFLYLLVDEHQDTNDSQNFIISLIAEFFETPNIFIVGDEKQAIYRFQGASVENFLKLQKRWPSMKVINLDTNYRSHQGILDASFTMIENNYSEGEYVDLRIQLKSGNKGESKPLDIVMGENTPAIEQYLIDSLRNITETEPNASIAIITRRNRELERIIRLLESSGVPVSSERSVDIFHHPLGVAFFDLIEYVLDPSRVDSLAKTLIAGMWGVSFEQSVEIIRALKGGVVNDVDQILPAILKIRKRMIVDGSVGGVIHIAEESGFVGLVSQDPSFVHVWRGIVTLAESIARDSDIESPVLLMETMLKYKLSAESKTVKVSVGAPDFPIKAMSAHKSKGLEFDYVFIPYANEEMWVDRIHGSSFILPRKKTNDGDIRDTRRLFYVALTRAKKHAVILYSMEESDGKTLTPLRFINELHKDNIKETYLLRGSVSIRNISKETNKNNNTDVLMLSEAKKVLLESGLSVTALNHFLECPNKFLYESILKMPQAPSLSAEKGSAMHEAISRIWAQRENDPIKVKNIIISTIEEYINKSLLSLGDKDRLKKELSENAYHVAIALQNHFLSAGQVSTERWFEAFYDTKYGSERLSIPIHGKLDTVLQNKDEISVFDYKTRRGMSVSAIKGETKSENGSYFRQLVFYKMLLQDNSQWISKDINTSLVFVSPDEKGRCPIVTIDVDEEHIKNLKEEIDSLVQSVWSGKITTETCGDSNCQYCGYRRLLL